MEQWLVQALIALVLYGFWGFFPKLAVQYITPIDALVYEVAGVLVATAVVLFFQGTSGSFHSKGVLFAFLTGCCGLVGTFFYFMAVKRGNISIVVSLTALYPLITIVLAVLILKEPIGLKQALGIVLALAAILLLSS